MATYVQKYNTLQKAKELKKEVLIQEAKDRKMKLKKLKNLLKLEKINPLGDETEIAITK
jgi:hypothetical protein